MKHEFTVSGQPIPYTRVTQRSKFVSKQYKRYTKYKAKICRAFWDSISKEDREKYSRNLASKGKPLNSAEKVYVWAKAFFKNRKHGDMDNIFKGVLDALFISDKHVAGTFDFDYNAENPRLEILITDDIKDFGYCLWNEFNFDIQMISDV